MKYDENKVEKWALNIPECEDFINNFFESCREDGISGFLNYVTDIRSYGKTYKSIRDNSALLLKAYEDITGMRVNYG